MGFPTERPARSDGQPKRWLTIIKPHIGSFEATFDMADEDLVVTVIGDAGGKGIVRVTLDGTGGLRHHGEAGDALGGPPEDVFVRPLPQVQGPDPQGGTVRSDEPRGEESMEETQGPARQVHNGQASQEAAERAHARQSRSEEIRRRGVALRQACERAVRGMQALQRAFEAGRDKVTVQAHHDDYSRPLEVRWLCEEHHRPPWVVDRG